MKRLNFLFFSSAVIFAGFILFIFLYSPDNQIKFTIADIKVSIDGKVKKKVALRENLFTHALITRPEKADTLIFLGDRLDSVTLGDRLVKYKNSPFIYIVKQNEKPEKLRYALISKSILNDNDFPENWKDSCRTTWKSAVTD